MGPCSIATNSLLLRFCFTKWWGFGTFDFKSYFFSVRTSPDVRIRIRWPVIRIQIAETRIRTVISVTAEQGALVPKPFLFHLCRYIINFQIAPYSQCRIFAFPWDISIGTNEPRCTHAHSLAGHSHAESRNPHTHRD